ncbi:MAG: hypothetical protein E7613_06685 [Ruminococcaceae bacterium]|nr:hypothetical protein [Oscillospiraceae bacterium]
MNGFVKLNRKILESAVFQDAQLLRLWIYILCRACYKEQDAVMNGIVVHLKKGQLTAGRKAVALALGVSESMAYTNMKKLEKLGFISIESRSKFSLITVEDWEKHQVEESAVEETAEEPCKETKKEEKPNGYGRYKNVFLTKEEYDKLRRNYWEADSKIDNMSSHIARTGRKYSSPYDTLCKWLEADGNIRSRGYESDGFDPDEFFEAALRKSM